jgi:hypothetical protein
MELSVSIWLSIKPNRFTAAELIDYFSEEDRQDSQLACQPSALPPATSSSHGALSCLSSTCPDRSKQRRNVYCVLHERPFRIRIDSARESRRETHCGKDWPTAQ